MTPKKFRSIISASVDPYVDLKKPKSPKFENMSKFT